MTLQRSGSYPYAHFSRNMGHQGGINCFIYDEVGFLQRLTAENAPKPRPVPAVPTDIELTTQAPGPLNLNPMKAIA